MRRFVIIGQTATASADFRLDDLPSTSGRVDVLLRCVRAALLVSHGVRRDVVVDLVLGAGAGHERIVRFVGKDAKFIRPDERSLATLLKKVLAADTDANPSGLVEVRPGVWLARGGFEWVIANLESETPYILDSLGEDIREIAAISAPRTAFFVGDHIGLSDAVRGRLAALGARSLSVGPVSLHAEDVVAVIANEIDRREAGPALRHPRGTPEKPAQR